MTEGKWMPNEPTAEMSVAIIKANLAHDREYASDKVRRSHRIYRAMYEAAEPVNALVVVTSVEGNTIGLRIRTALLPRKQPTVILDGEPEESVNAAGRALKLADHERGAGEHPATTPAPAAPEQAKAQRCKCRWPRLAPDSKLDAEWGSCLSCGKPI